MAFADRHNHSNMVRAIPHLYAPPGVKQQQATRADNDKLSFMDMSTIFPRLCRCPAWRARLLAAALLTTAVAPAWTMPSDGYAPAAISPVMHNDFTASIRTAAAPPLLQDDSNKAAHSAQSISDVRVFPVWVPGPVLASAHSRYYRKFAQASEADKIAVIYPDIAEPYRSVFTQIINGIKDQAKGHVTDYAVDAQPDIAALKSALRSQNAKVVIALGRVGMKTANTLDGNFDVVVGGVLGAPQNEGSNIQVNSLAPDPRLLFSRLKEMMPGARRVFTVYDPRQNTWIMQLAKDAAQAQGLKLVAYKARDLRSAMLDYRKIFSIADSRHDALWLPQDSTTTEEGTALPLVLRDSWDHDLVVFSSSFSHVSRGVLFSLYPDNVGLGRHLADSALNYIASGKNKAGIVPLREVLMAVNLRTARHLGIDVSHLKDLDLAFPRK